MESIYRALNILKEYKISESDNINEYISYANKIIEAKPKYNLDESDKKIIKCIINPKENFNITEYGSGAVQRSIKGVNVKEIMLSLDMNIEDEQERIYGMIISEYIDPIVPTTMEITKVSDAITEIGIKANSKEHAELLMVLYKCTWLVKYFEKVDLGLLQEGYESYIRIIFSDLETYKKYVEDTVKNTSKKTYEYNQKLIESKKNIDEINKKVKIINTKIDKFNSNIVSILSILVAIFSVIGINIGTIPKIENNLIINVVMINFSLIFIIVTLFWLVDVIAFENRHKIIEVFLICILIILVIMFGVILVTQNILL